MEPTNNPITSVDMRKVSNGFVVRVTRAAGPPAAMSPPEEKVFTTWNDYVAWLSAEGFI